MKDSKTGDPGRFKDRGGVGLEKKSSRPSVLYGYFLEGVQLYASFVCGESLLLRVMLAPMMPGLWPDVWRRMRQEFPRKPRG